MDENEERIILLEDRSVEKKKQIETQNEKKKGKESWVSWKVLGLVVPEVEKKIIWRNKDQNFQNWWISNQVFEKHYKPQAG